MSEIEWTTKKPEDEGWYWVYPCRWYGEKSTRLAWVRINDNGNIYFDGSAPSSYLWSEIQTTWYAKVKELPIPATITHN